MLSAIVSDLFIARAASAINCSNIYIYIYNRNVYIYSLIDEEEAAKRLNSLWEEDDEMRIYRLRLVT